MLKTKKYQFFKENIKEKYFKFRRQAFESFGSDAYSRPSLHDLDIKLEKYLPDRNGFFIEAGANDGFHQSNTYYFERFRDWHGILIEGIPELYRKCAIERSKSKVFNCALVASDYQESHITMTYSNLMSIAEGARGSKEADTAHIKDGVNRQWLVEPYQIQVPARTLTSILDECQVEKIDLFSLDVEGYELNVLKGIDFDKYQPNWMLIEAWQRQEIDSYLQPLYEPVAKISYHDVLYKSKKH
jgi:FkbM family methyltransferase